MEDNKNKVLFRGTGLHEMVLVKIRHLRVDIQLQMGALKRTESDDRAKYIIKKIRRLKNELDFLEYLDKPENVYIGYGTRSVLLNSLRKR